MNFNSFDVNIQSDEFATEWEEFNAFLNAGWEDRIDADYNNMR